ncbi:MAG: hypothetical protein PHX20_04140 [Candidatus Omnitrophica bacterium]|nr:hypothetical protein [Candidatus Omnitrophota bacterium]
MVIMKSHSSDNEKINGLADSAKDKITSALGKVADREAAKALRDAISDIESIKKALAACSGGSAVSRVELARTKGLGAKEILKEYVDTALNQAVMSGVIISMVAFKVEGLSDLLVSMIDLEELVRSSLRRRADFVISDGNMIFVVLHETEKEEAVSVAERIRSVLIDYIAAKGGDVTARIEYKVGSSSEGAGEFYLLMGEEEL